MATLQQSFSYEGASQGLPLKSVRIDFQWPAFQFSDILRDGKPFIERSQSGSQSIPVIQDLGLKTYSAVIPNSLLVGVSDSSVLNFWKYLSQLGFANSAPVLPDELKATYRAAIGDLLGHLFSASANTAVYS